MARLAYEKWRPGPEARTILAHADAIASDYAAQGYDLTLRQLYYQFVARALIPNTQESYNRLGSFVAKGRMAGLLDWDNIVDRTRNLRHLSHWSSPAGVIRSAAASYHRDLWQGMPERVEVWVEKEALAGVVQRAAQAWDCAWFSCRGYVSLSEMHAAAQRVLRYIEDGQRVTILHLGDHDPSGLDMTRDITDRMLHFVACDYYRAHRDDFGPGSTIEDAVEAMAEELDGPPLTINRIALNRDQVDAYQPPPNPAKMTDSRAGGYVAEHGRSSWELDALDPATLDALIQDNISSIATDYGAEPYFTEQEREGRHREQLTAISDRWTDVVAWHEGGTE